MMSNFRVILEIQELQLWISSFNWADLAKCVLRKTHSSNKSWNRAQLNDTGTHANKHLLPNVKLNCHSKQYRGYDGYFKTAMVISEIQFCQNNSPSPNIAVLGSGILFSQQIAAPIFPTGVSKTGIVDPSPNPHTIRSTAVGITFTKRKSLRRSLSYQE